MSCYKEEINKKGNIAVEDTILVKDIPASAGSRILEGFKPLFSAEAVERLIKKGYAISGKTHVGEFSLDLVGEFSYYDKKEGKLLGSAAELVKSGEIKGAIGVDVNGSPRRAAALSDVLFLKPTYGTVSRYGVISTAASGEQIGAYAKDTDSLKDILEAISGYDEKDGTSLKDRAYSYKNDEDVSSKKVLIIKELFDMADDEVKKSILAYKEKLTKNGVKVEEVSLGLFDKINTAWQILMTAETCNNVSRYDGVKFGYRASGYKNIDELYVKSRTEGFNFLTKAVILYGSDVLSKNRYEECYDKSLRIRRVIKEKFDEIFMKYDAVLTPAVSKASFEAYDIKDAFYKVFSESIFTSLANLIGVPALAHGKAQLMGKAFSESTLLSLAKVTERMGE